MYVLGLQSNTKRKQCCCQCGKRRGFDRVPTVRNITPLILCEYPTDVHLFLTLVNEFTDVNGALDVVGSSGHFVIRAHNWVDENVEGDFLSIFLSTTVDKQRPISAVLVSNFTTGKADFEIRIDTELNLEPMIVSFLAHQFFVFLTQFHHHVQPSLEIRSSIAASSRPNSPDLNALSKFLIAPIRS
jgi:hypothetical protein